MRLSSWLIWGFVGFAAVFAGEALWRLFSPSDVFPWGTMLLAAGYCLLCAFLLVNSQGLHRAVMFAFLLAVLLVFVFRLQVLTFAPDWFVFSHIVILSSSAIERSLWFAAGSTVAFWAGVRLVTGKARWPSPSANQGGHGSTLFRYRHLVMLVGLAFLVVSTVIFASLGKAYLEQGWLAYLSRVFQIEGIGVVLMYLTVQHWREMTRTDKVAMAGTVALISVAGLVFGQKAVIFLAFLWWIFVTVLVKEDPKIPLKLGVFGGLLFLFVVPSLTGVVLNIREGVGAGGTVLTAAEYRVGKWEGLGALDVMRIYGGRLSGADAMIVVTSYDPPGIGPYITPSKLGLSFAEKFVPRAIWDPAVLAPGKVFALFYQGVPPESAHTGGWPGFSFYYAYFGPFGFIVLAGVGAATGFLVLTLSRGGGLVSRPMACWVLYGLTWNLILSGNPDGALYGFLITWIMVGIILWITVAVGQSPQRRISVPAA